MDSYDLDKLYIGHSTNYAMVEYKYEIFHVYFSFEKGIGGDPDDLSIDDIFDNELVVIPYGMQYRLGQAIAELIWDRDFIECRTITPKKR